jgi:hypothetical protein
MVDPTEALIQIQDKQIIGLKARVTELEAVLERVATTVWDEQNNPRVYVREVLNLKP